MLIFLCLTNHSLGRQLLSVHKNLAVFINTSDLMSLVGEGGFNLPKKRCFELASHAFAYFAKVDESIAEDYKSALDSFDKRVLVVGAGGREHAIVRTLSQSEKVAQIFVAPGNFGTGVESEKCCNVNIAADDIPTLVAFAQQQQVDLVVVGPEQPLVLGLADQLRAVVRLSSLLFPIRTSLNSQTIEYSLLWPIVSCGCDRGFQSLDQGLHESQQYPHCEILQLHGL